MTTARSPLIVTACLLATVSACISSADRPATSDTDADTSAAAETQQDSDVSRCTGGQRRCSEDLRQLEVCEDGQWEARECAAAAVCLDFGIAECRQTTGEFSCRQVFDCLVSCGLPDDRTPEPGVELCHQECYIRGKAVAQQDIQSLTQCLERIQCGDDLECIGERCDAHLATCLYDGEGDASCSQILACRAHCATDLCSLNCAEGGDFLAQRSFAMVELCTRFHCGLAASQACISSARTTACRSFLSACQADDD